MVRDEQRIFILRVWLERTRSEGGADWRASLTDEADRSRPRYFSSLTDLLAHLRDLLEGRE